MPTPPGRLLLNVREEPSIRYDRADGREMIVGEQGIGAGDERQQAKSSASSAKITVRPFSWALPKAGQVSCRHTSTVASLC